MPLTARTGAGRVLSVLLAAGMAAGCGRPGLPAGGQGPRSVAPAVATRGPDDAALTTADVTGPMPIAGRAVTGGQWRSGLDGRGTATLVLPAPNGARDLPPEAAVHVDALARLLDAERGWRLSISATGAPAGRAPHFDIQRAHALRLALVARGVTGDRLAVEPPPAGWDPPPRGTVRFHLRRRSPRDRPNP
ncbi:hypothetical protein [Lysobacter sp. A3-1-A15]|uniref:hypothetical protein n=1 Tax=Novilysobacter viscosus TaxID=3098602 RepID=UPI003983355C